MSADGRVMNERQVVGSVQPRGANRQIAACCTEHSLWVEISGPKGGRAWQMAPHIAREVAHKLTIAADMAEGFHGSDRHPSQRSNDAPSTGPSPALDPEGDLMANGPQNFPWRVGRKVGRTIYMCKFEPGNLIGGRSSGLVIASDDDQLIGVMDTPEIASAAVNAHNAAIGFGQSSERPADTPARGAGDAESHGKAD